MTAADEGNERDELSPRVRESCGTRPGTYFVNFVSFVPDALIWDRPRWRTGRAYFVSFVSFVSNALVERVIKTASEFRRPSLAPCGRFSYSRQTHTEE